MRLKTCSLDPRFPFIGKYYILNFKPGREVWTLYWTKWTIASLFYIPLDLVRQETVLFAYPGTKPYTNQYAV